METDKIRDAVLEKAKSEADKVITDAEERAREIEKKAKDQQRDRFEDVKKKIIADARREAAKITAQASLRGRQAVLKEKDTILTMIVDRVKTGLSETPMGQDLFLALVKETLAALETDKQLVLYVAPRDMATVRGYIDNDSDLANKIATVKEHGCLGGVMVETDDGMVSIDNTFDMRLEMLIPKILPEIGKKLFGDGER